MGLRARVQDILIASRGTGASSQIPIMQNAIIHFAAAVFDPVCLVIFFTITAWLLLTFSEFLAIDGRMSSRKASLSK